MQAVNSEKDEDVTDMIEDAVDGDFPTKKEVKEAKDYTSKANGREQEKIEKFLDRKGIETINFQK